MCDSVTPFPFQQDEVNLTEETIEKEQAEIEEQPKKESTTSSTAPKPKQINLAVPNKPAPIASPETRRRAEMIKVDVSIQQHLYI